MRQKNNFVVVIIIVLCAAVALIAFAILRTRTPHTDTHDDIHADQPSHENHHEHELKLSGELVNGVRVVKIKARRFEFDPDTIVVKVEENIRFEITSQDVTHGIEIKDFGINQVLKPGKTESLTFVAGKSGRHHFHCSVYCGKGHNQMHGELIVLHESR